MESITLNYIKDIIKAYSQKLQEIDSTNKSIWSQEVKQARGEFQNCMRMISAIYPELFQVNMPDFMDEEDLQNLGERLSANSNRRFSLDYLATASHLTDVVNG